MAWCQGITIIIALVATAVCNDCYEKTTLRSIPPGHLYHKLHHPTVIGHMGNIHEFQENTLEGIKSLIQIKAGGVHMHVQLTKDDQLVLFQDSTLYRMTGEDFDVSKLPYGEILKMNLLTKIPYYKSEGDYNNVLKTFEYRSTLKVPLLSEALQLLKGKGLLIYLELMPKKIATSPLDRFLGLRTGEKTAKLVGQMGMEKEVLIVSRDVVKLVGANHLGIDVPLGWWVDPSLYQRKTADTMKVKYNDLPGVYSLEHNCLNKTGATGFPFTKYMISSGYISKATNTSFVDFAIDVFGDKSYFDASGKTSSLKEVISKNYGGSVSFGAFDVFTVNSTKKTAKEDVEFIERVSGYGVSRIVTNDVNRVKLALDEKTITYSKGKSTQSYLELVVLLLVVSKTIASLIFIS